MAQKDDPGSQKVEDNRSCKGDAALAAIGEDDPCQEQTDDDKDGEPEDLVDGIRMGRVEIDQEDHDGKDGVGHLLDDDSSPCCSLLSVISWSKRMTKDVRDGGVGQVFFSSISHHNKEVHCSGNQC